LPRAFSERTKFRVLLQVALPSNSWLRAVIRLSKGSSEVLLQAVFNLLVFVAGALCGNRVAGDDDQVIS
jgi:hypothetical protein